MGAPFSARWDVYKIARHSFGSLGWSTSSCGHGRAGFIFVAGGRQTLKGTACQGGAAQATKFAELHIVYSKIAVD
jgi:hypothetical protein